MRVNTILKPSCREFPGLLLKSLFVSSRTSQQKAVNKSRQQKTTETSKNIQTYPSTFHPPIPCLFAKKPTFPRPKLTIPPPKLKRSPKSQVTWLHSTCNHTFEPSACFLPAMANTPVGSLRYTRVIQFIGPLFSGFLGQMGVPTIRRFTVCFLRNYLTAAETTFFSLHDLPWTHGFIGFASYHPLNVPKIIQNRRPKVKNNHSKNVQT